MRIDFFKFASKNYIWINNIKFLSLAQFISPPLPAPTIKVKKRLSEIQFLTAKHSCHEVLASVSDVVYAISVAV